MSYYPNNYVNYSPYMPPVYPVYGNNGYMGQPTNMPQQTQQAIMNTNQQNMPQNNNVQSQTQNVAVGLPGKIVENKDVVGITEIQPNSWAVYPKFDFSEVYIKTWRDGETPTVRTYMVVNDEKKENQNSNINPTNEILQNMKTISNEITDLHKLISSFENGFTVFNNEISDLKSKFSQFTNSLGG